MASEAEVRVALREVLDPEIGKPIEDIGMLQGIQVDGGNVRNSIEGNTGMNFSQEVIQEFQLSSANLDL